jgi:hypothetical protein
MAPFPALDLHRLARHGAETLFTQVVQRIYETLTGEKAKGHPVRLLERLTAEDRITPDAALYLLAFARALHESGALSGRALTGLVDIEAHLRRIGDRFVAGLPDWLRT